MLMYFRNYRLSKTWLDHYLRSDVLDHPLRVNILQGPQHLLNFYESMFIIFSIFLQGTHLANISLIVM